MYDYISIHSNNFASFIKNDSIENFLILNLNCIKQSTLVFTMELFGYKEEKSKSKRKNLMIGKETQIKDKNHCLNILQVIKGIGNIKRRK
ncbi:MAG: hypothetical protein K0R18_2254 [Bacillales bacterium]|nr:hypothetical protein [Bacillales bacterium]